MAEAASVETGRITITRVIEDDGRDSFYVDLSEDLGFVETLGLLEASKDTIIRMFMEEA